jgi:PGF-pre-PGF domain-containing protein
MKTGLNKIGLVSALLILITAVMVTAAPLPSAPVITGVNDAGDGVNVNITWQAGTNYFKDISSGTQIASFDDVTKTTKTTVWRAYPDSMSQQITESQAHYQEGTGSAEITVTGGSDINIVKNEYDNNFTELNLSQGDGFSMWVYVQNATASFDTLHLKFITLADNTSDYTTEKCNICFDAKYNSKYLVNGWNRINFAKSDFNVFGNAKWTDKFSNVQIIILPLNTNYTAKVDLDDLRFNENGRPTVMITFDDGLVSAYDTAKGILDNNGQKATSFVIPNATTKSNYMSVKQLYLLQQDGWDISSHTWNHDHLITGNMTDTEITTSLTDSRQWLIDNGFAATSNFSAYPFNEFDDNIVNITNDVGYVMARTVKDGTYEDSPSILTKDDSLHSLLRLKAIEVMKKTTMSDLTNLTKHTKDTNSTLQFLFHNIYTVPTSTDNYEVSADTLQQLSNELKSENISVVTYSDYWNTINSVKADGYIININGNETPAPDMNFKVNYTECASTTIYAVTNSGQRSAPISIAQYCPNAVQVNGIVNGGYNNTNVTITLFSPLEGNINYNLNDKPAVIASSGSFNVTDEGNYVLTVSGLTYRFVIDKTPPKTKVVGVAEGQNYLTPAGVTINFNSTDDISGVKTTIYNLDQAGDTNYNGTDIIRTLVGNHLLTYKTYDWANNMVQGTINFTISNPPNPPVVKGSSGGGGGGGGGGASMSSSENFTNLAKFESEDGYIHAGKDTTLTFSTIERGIFQLLLSGETQDISARVENLKGLQNGAIDAPGKVHLYTNVLINSNRIGNISIYFKLNNSEIINADNVKLYIWNNAGWEKLDTKTVSSSAVNTYFMSNAPASKLSKFAISEIPSPDSASQSTMYSSPMQAQKLEPGGNMTAIVPANDRPKAPGFGVFAAILVIAILYVKLKK